MIGVIGWLFSYTYFFHLIGPYADTCNNGDGSPYSFSMIAGPATLLISGLLIWVGMKKGRQLLLLAIPHIFTYIAALFILPRYFFLVTFLGEHICAGNGIHSSFGLSPDDPLRPLWHRSYAPIHLLSLAVFLIYIFRVRKRTNLGDVLHYVN